MKLALSENYNLVIVYESLSHWKNEVVFGEFGSKQESVLSGGKVNAGFETVRDDYDYSITGSLQESNL